MIDRFDFEHFNDDWMFNTEEDNFRDDDFMEDMRREQEIENQLEIDLLVSKIKRGL